MGFNMLFNIIFGITLLTERLVPVFVFLAYFRVLQKRNTKRSPNGMKPSRRSFLDPKQSRRLGVEVWNSTRRPWGRRARPRGAPPVLWTPWESTDLPLSSINPQLLQYQQKCPPKYFSAAASIHSRKIPSWGLFRHPAGGGFDHGGHVHQLYCPSDEAWVV